MAKTALIVVDMLNPYEHEDADKLIKSVEQTLPTLVKLRDRVREEGVPTIYVNDNHGDWESSRGKLVDAACEGARPDLVEPILPGEDDLFLAKTRHSIFYATPLEYILAQEEIDRIVLAGQVTEQCVLYSALDAYVRHFELAIPTDAVAAIYDHLAEAALEMMERNLTAELCAAAECALR